MREKVIDTGVAVLVAAVLCLRVAGPFEQNAVPPDWRAYGLMVLVGASMLVRRRHPMAVLYGTLVVLLIYYNLGFGAVGAIWPLSAALFNASLFGKWREAATVGGFVLLGASAWRLLVETEGSVMVTFSDVLTELLLGTAVILAGAMVRNHRQLVSEVRARERAVAAEREADARGRLVEQRLHIARDVHDIVAHSLAGIGVQARLAEELVGPDATEARRSIRAIIDTTTDAMARLRQTVGSLRDSPPVPLTLREVVEGVAGIEVELVRDDVSYRDDIEATILAITREALTNVVRHSGATRAIVTVTDSPDGVAVDIVDNGGASGDPVEGNGIRGMRERAESLGGSLEAGPAPSGGFAVSARLPT